MEREVRGKRVSGPTPWVGQLAQDLEVEVENDLEDNSDDHEPEIIGVEAKPGRVLKTASVCFSKKKPRSRRPRKEKAERLRTEACFRSYVINKGPRQPQKRKEFTTKDRS